MWSKAAWALALALTASNAYRAATQSMTTDEAFTFNSYVGAPLAMAIKHYDANNHVQNSLLERASVACLGVSEFSVRLPSVLGGALYLATLVRLCFYVFGEGWFALLAVALAGLNPFVLDYLTAARGYGIALGLMVFAMDRMVRHVAENRPGVPYGAGVALGLAVAANLVFAVPAAALGAVLAALLWRERGWWVMGPLVDGFALPAAVAACLVLVVPMCRAGAGNYYYGARTLADMVKNVAVESFAPAVVGGWGYSVAKLLYERLWMAVPIAAVLAAAAGAGSVAVFRAARRPGPVDACLAFTGGAVAIALAALFAARHLFGVLYPLGRTAIYWVPLLALATLALSARTRLLRVPAAVVAALCIVQFLLLYRVTYFNSWLADAGVKPAVNVVRAREGARPVRIVASWQLEPSLNFYRRRYRLDWLEPVTRDGAGAPGDYHVLAEADADVVRKLGLTVLYRDPLSGTLLAR